LITSLAAKAQTQKVSSLGGFKKNKSDIFLWISIDRVKPTHAVTCIKSSPFSCSVIEKFV
jgi:hypothetical protein